MNSNELEQLLLLEQSGELSSKQRRQLEAELAVSAEARRLRAEVRRLAAAIPASAAQPAPSATAIIAARLRQAPKPALAFQPIWKPVVAAAAALALLLGVHTFHGGKAADPTESAAVAAASEEEDWTDPLEADFTELESLLAAISSDDALEITEL
jgi:anti-sigma factor RsiW